MEEKRRVIIYKMEWSKEESKHVKTATTTGEFQQYGLEEGEGGSYSTAIIELDDGTVRNVPVEMIKFIKITTKNGLLYFNNEELLLPAADIIARENNFPSAEQFVKYLELKQKEQK